MTFGEKLAALIELRRTTQTKLAEAIGLQGSRISRWCKGEGNPSVDQRALLAGALRVPFAYLADPNRTEPPDLAELETEQVVYDLIRMIGWDEVRRRLVLRAPDDPKWEDVDLEVEFPPPPPPKGTRRLEFGPGFDSDEGDSPEADESLLENATAALLAYRKQRQARRQPKPKPKQSGRRRKPKG